MFARHKRLRDQDDDMEEDYPYMDNKKLRTLPFRSSPTSQCTIPSFSSRHRTVQRPQTLTPVESSDDESEYGPPSAKANEQPSINLHLADADEDVDMDMMSDSFEEPAWSPMKTDSSFSQSFPSSTRSNLTISAPSARMNVTGPRVPTPIYGHFSAPSYPGGMPPPSPSMPPPSYSNPLTFPRVRGTGEEALSRRRALPSPISEDEFQDSSTSSAETMLSNLKMDAFSSSHTSSSQETLTPETPGLNTWTADSSPKSRRRSDAISGQSPKVVFSMGFRADCEKCRERVPGHYNHIIRS